MPYITQVAVGKREELGVFGNDYDTPDGTGVRDYIHVCNLAAGHVCALKAIERKCGLAIYNLGTGHGYSVLDVVKAFEKANGVILSFMGVKVMRFFQSIKEYEKGIVWKRIIKQNQSSRLAVGIGSWLASFL